MNIPKNGFYFHYKHDPNIGFNYHAYEVLGLAWGTEDEKHYVVYRPLYENTFLAPANVCIRPLEMFNEDIEKDGKMMSRFTHITDPELISKLEAVRSKMW